MSGQVLIDDKPLTYGQIFFIPPNGRTARAKIGPDGRFTLTSFNANDGAIKGTHKIAIYANEQLNSNDIKWHAPIKYSKEATSGLTQEITGPTDSIVIKLTWDGGKPFVVKGEPEAEGKKGKS